MDGVISWIIVWLVVPLILLVIVGITMNYTYDQAGEKGIAGIGAGLVILILYIIVTQNTRLYNIYWRILE